MADSEASLAASEADAEAELTASVAEATTSEAELDTLEAISEAEAEASEATLLAPDAIEVTMLPRERVAEPMAPPMPKMVVEPVVVVKVEPSVVMTPVRAEVVMAEELPEVEDPEAPPGLELSVEAAEAADPDADAEPDAEAPRAPEKDDRSALSPWGYSQCLVSVVCTHSRSIERRSR